MVKNKLMTSLLAAALVVVPGVVRAGAAPAPTGYDLEKCVNLCADTHTTELDALRDLLKDENVNTKLEADQERYKKYIQRKIALITIPAAIKIETDKTDAVSRSWVALKEALSATKEDEDTVKAKSKIVIEALKNSIAASRFARASASRGAIIAGISIAAASAAAVSGKKLGLELINRLYSYTGNSSWKTGALIAGGATALCLVPAGYKVAKVVTRGAWSFTKKAGSALGKCAQSIWAIGSKCCSKIGTVGENVLKRVDIAMYRPLGLNKLWSVLTCAYKKLEEEGKTEKKKD